MSAQGKGIGIGTSSVHKSAVLQISSETNTQGVIFPIMDQSQRNKALPKAAPGLLVYDSLEHVFYQKNKGYNAWEALVPIPRGIIVMWSGNESTIPKGWILCNGKNGTPDLRGRFVLGYDDGTGGMKDPTNTSDTKYRTVNNTGGEKLHTLTVNEMPTHNHYVDLTASTGGHHAHGITTFNDNFDETGGQPETGKIGWTNDSKFTNYDKFPKRNTDHDGLHSHTVKGNSNTRGNSKPHENRPPYYVLAFIMKTYYKP